MGTSNLAKSALINFGLVQLSNNTRNEASWYKLLGMNSLFCNRKQRISRKDLRLGEKVGARL